MAETPRFRQLSLQDYPEAPAWMAALFTVLNDTLGGLVNALNNGLTRSENLASKARVGIAFRTPASGNATLLFGNDLGATPTHVWPTKLARKDGTAIAAPYALTWSLNSGGQVQVTMLGLVASTDYLLSVLYE